MTRARREVILCSAVFIGLLSLLAQGWVDAGTPADIGPLPAAPVPEDNPLTPEKIEKKNTIVLFEELEKADRALYDLLLQVLERGELKTGRGVDLRDNWITRTHARLEEVLRLKVFLVRKVIDGEVEVDPGANALSHAEVDHI